MDRIEATLYEVLAKLKQQVLQLNTPANLDGVLAAHFDVNSRLAREMTWQVYIDPGEWAHSHESSLDQAPELAVLGALLAEYVKRYGQVAQEVASSFQSHVQSVQRRQKIFSVPYSWVFQPTVVLGITLGVKAVSDPQLAKWLSEVLHEGIKHSDLSFPIRCTYLYALALLGQSPPRPSTPDLPSDLAQSSVAELAMSIWLARRGLFTLAGEARDTWLEQACAHLVERLITESPYEAADYKAALLWETARSYIETRSHFPRLDVVRLVLSNFLPSLERWKPKWTITDEYDVQTLLWLMLRPYFDNLKYEDYLPKFGRSGQRYDIGIPELGLIIEAKYIRQVSDFQKIVDEIGKDSAQLQPQSAFTGIIVFAYDESCSSEHHEWTRIALRSIALVQEAFIVPAPAVSRRGTPNESDEVRPVPRRGRHRNPTRLAEE